MPRITVLPTSCVGSEPVLPPEALRPRRSRAVDEATRRRCRRRGRPSGSRLARLKGDVVRAGGFVGHGPYSAAVIFLAAPSASAEHSAMMAEARAIGLVR